MLKIFTLLVSVLMLQTSALASQDPDSYWGEIAQGLIADVNKGIDLVPRLKTVLPILSAQLVSDSQDKELQKLWGKSINFDEIAQDIIVHRAILKALIQLAQAESYDSPIAHAGLIHTYGYLFSVLKTPFGYKRARWVRPDIENGMGLPRGSLGPAPEEGTLLANVTCLAARIAFRENKACAKAAKAVSNLDFSALKIKRLEESAQFEGGELIFRTDFVSFPHPSGSANTHLLVYSVMDCGESRLITVFPVDTPFVERSLKPEDLGNEKPIVSRYNAYVPAAQGKALVGLRRVL